MDEPDCSDASVALTPGALVEVYATPVTAVALLLVPPPI
jgi:hypothetical protein